MLRLPKREHVVLDPVRSVVREIVHAVPGFPVDSIMLVGAHCRDILHLSLGNTDVLRATHDLDLALSLSDWRMHEELTEVFPRSGSTQIRYLIGGTPVDLVPFGKVETGTGIAYPPSRTDFVGSGPVGVWALQQAFEDSLPLALESETVIRIPTVHGYSAAKLGAWVDRAALFEFKDASDLGTAMRWYANSLNIEDRLYGDDQGVLLAENLDVALGSARLLAIDIRGLVGGDMLRGIRSRWGDYLPKFISHMSSNNHHPMDTERCHEIANAFDRGLWAEAPSR
ncbi:MAG TPA: hypothetical protein PLQ19_04490 [Aeromicrobium sp.]|mgnify:CR=1 FL=1|nr:hypothetical protein [Aeromicrobium sp.]